MIFQVRSVSSTDRAFRYPALAPQGDERRIAADSLHNLELKTLATGLFHADICASQRLTSQVQLSAKRSWLGATGLSAPV
jgi:hypothetical protein